MGLFTESIIEETTLYWLKTIGFGNDIASENMLAILRGRMFLPMVRERKLG